MNKLLVFKSVIMVILCLLPQLSWANTKEFHLTLENHVFSPAELIIPANRKVKLIIHNKDAVAEEFDSFDLNREKVLFSNKKTTIFVGPLKEGKYEYFGEYNPNTARGIVVVRREDAN